MSFLRRLAVQTNAHSFKLGFEERPLFGPLGGIQHHEDHVARFGCRDDLSTSAFSFRGPLDDTGQIEELNFGTAIFQDTRNGCQGGEGVGRDFGSRLGDLGQECRLADGRKSDQGNSRISAFANVEAGTPAATSSRTGFEELGSETGKLSGMVVSKTLPASRRLFSFTTYPLRRPR